MTEPQEDPEGTVREAAESARPPAPVDAVDWLLFPVFLLFFLATLLVFEAIQRVAILFGSIAQQRAAVYLSKCLKACLAILGTRIRVNEPSPGYIASLRTDRPYIVVSTHQSLFDICILASIFGRHFPRFVSKQELAYGIPSVSYNLRVGGAALIDRKNPRQAIPEIKRFAGHLTEKKFAAVIFPEGTRARNGIPKAFHPAGLTVLLAAAPDAAVIPVLLDGTWHLSYRKFGPIPRGVRVLVSVLPAIEREEGDSRSLVPRIFTVINEERERLFSGASKPLTS
jgi:1-acyl-sn-glycerol-3-phosphate acyltransferase